MSLKIKQTDEWQTPHWLFNGLNAEFDFSVDACANNNNKKCELYLKDALDDKCWLETKNGSVFLNPPYSNPYPFIQKAWNHAKLRTVVCLVKVDTSTKWWSIFWDYAEHKPKQGCSIRFLSKRLKFESPSGIKSPAANFPSAVVIMDRRFAA